MLNHALVAILRGKYVFNAFCKNKTRSNISDFTIPKSHVLAPFQKEQQSVKTVDTRSSQTVHPA